jgi:hypothetical protein
MEVSYVVSVCVAGLRGTRRFAHATGKAEFEGGGTPIAGLVGLGWFSFQGAVSSPGASKK